MRERRRRQRERERAARACAAASQALPALPCHRERAGRQRWPVAHNFKIERRVCLDEPLRALRVALGCRVIQIRARIWDWGSAEHGRAAVLQYSPTMMCLPRLRLTNMTDRKTDSE